MRRSLPAVLLAGAVVPGPGPAAGVEPGPTLSLYGQGFAVVEQRRRVELPAGEASLRLQGVSRRLEPETLMLSAPGVAVLELRARTRPLSRQVLLEAFVGDRVRVIREHPETGERLVEEAELLSVAEGPVLRFADRVEAEPPGRIAFPRLPADIPVRPSVEARLRVAEAGARMLLLRYLSEGLSWHADYVAEVAADGASLDLTALASLANESGADYTKATVRLVAGEVNRVGRPGPRPQRTMALAAEEAAPIPEERPAAELYRYDLPRPVSLVDGTEVQVPLLAAQGVAVERRYRLEGLATATSGADEAGPVSARVLLDLANEQAAGLGRPLPAGVVRVYGGGEAAGLFLGAARIPHTPAGERLELAIGGAFDVTGRARTTGFERISQRAYELAREVVVGNAKAEPVAVEVVGRFPHDWRIIEESHPHETETAAQPLWRLRVPAEGETTLTYRVRVSR